MRKVLILTVAVILFCAYNVLAFDFSADVINTAKGQVFAGKMYVSGDKVRMEAAGTTTISRMDKKVVWVIMPGQNMYMEQPLNPESVAGAAEKMPGEIERTLIGPDMVDGMAASKYRIRYITETGEAVVLQWIDPKINMPVKTAAEDGSWMVEYKNIIVGTPPDSLFDLPAGYKKFAMPDMKEMMRGVQQ